MSSRKYFLAVICMSLIIMTALYSQVSAQNSAPEYSQNEHNRTAQYDDPVDLARDIIQRTHLFWTPLGYTTTKAVYTVGAWFAMHGAGYLLLESPNVAIDLVQGGFYKVVGSISYDLILEIIESSVKTPRKICKKISKSVIKEGLSDYEAAYNIARDYINTGNLSRDDALKFLNHRWGLYKLAIARTLYNESNNVDYNIVDQVAERATNELLEIFQDKYQNALNIDNKMPLIQSALFIKDISDILRAKQIGLMNYTPYLNFTNYMDILNQAMIDELKKFTETDDGVITLGFILDSSGSMGSNDPQDMRKVALMNIIKDRLLGNENVLIVDFDDSAKLLNNKISNWSESDLLNAVKKIDSSGGTNIESGLSKMKNSISNISFNRNKTGVFLLSDGCDNHTKSVSVNWFSQNNIPVYAVSFIGTANEGLMEQIADNTGGVYLKANNPQEITNFFNMFYNRITGSSMFALEKSQITQDEVIIYYFDIDNINDRLYFSSNWLGSKIGMKLISPSGRIYQENDNNARWNIGKNFVTASIPKPEVGQWKVELKGVQIPSQGEKFSLEVHGKSDLEFDLGSNTTSSGIIDFSIDCNNDQLIRNYTTSGKVQCPDGKEKDITDKLQNSQFTYLPSSGKGSYKFEIDINGTRTDGHKFQRNLSRHVFVGSYAPPHIKPITHVYGMGNFVNADIGTNVGNTPALTCYIYRGDTDNNDNMIAKGVITNCSEIECTAEITYYFTNTIAQKGDILKLDENEWKAD